MTPKGFEAVVLAIGDATHYWVSPSPKEGQDLPFVTVGTHEIGHHHGSVLSPAKVLNALAEAHMLQSTGNLAQRKHIPHLTVEPGMVTPHSITFRDQRATPGKF